MTVKPLGSSQEGSLRYLLHGHRFLLLGDPEHLHDHVRWHLLACQLAARTASDTVGTRTTGIGKQANTELTSVSRPWQPPEHQRDWLKRTVVAQRVELLDLGPACPHERVARRHV